MVCLIELLLGLAFCKCSSTTEYTSESVNVCSGPKFFSNKSKSIALVVLSAICLLIRAHVRHANDSEPNGYNIEVVTSLCCESVSQRCPACQSTEDASIP